MVSRGICELGSFLETLASWVFCGCKGRKSEKYYEQFGFIPMPDNQQQLFLAMKGLQQAYQTIS